MKVAFVTGGTGFIGQRLCEKLVEEGVQVRALVRSKEKAAQMLPSSVQYVEGDLSQREVLLEGMQGADTAFHIAALYREAKFPDSMYWKVNFEGTRLMLECAQKAGISFFLHCSTTGVLGNIEHPPADESYPYGPLDVYQESKTEAEKLVKEWFASGSIKGAIIRPAMVWGPRDTRILKLFRGIASRKLPIIGDGQTLCHWVHVDDVVKGFLLAARTPQSHGQLYFIAGERPVTLQYTMEQIAKAYQTSLWPFKIPVKPIQLAGDLVEKICIPFGVEPPLHRRRVDFFVKNRAFVIDKAKRELSYQPTYSFEEEVALVAQWYREHNWV